MAIQGLVSFVDKDYNVLAKVVVGCNGYNVNRFIEHINKLEAEYLELVAKYSKFGCDDCRVISTSKTTHFNIPEYLGEGLFYSKFDDPGFNPRWGYGTADYVRIVIWE